MGSRILDAPKFLTADRITQSPFQVYPRAPPGLEEFGRDPDLPPEPARKRIPRGQRTQLKEKGDVLKPKKNEKISAKSAADRIGEKKQLQRTVVADAEIGKAFLELYAGHAGLTSACADKGLRTAVPFDDGNGEHFDLTRPPIGSAVLSWIVRQLLWWMHLGTPCRILSVAGRSFKRKKEEMQMCLANVDFCVRVILFCLKHNVHFSLENLLSSGIWELKQMAKLLSDERVYVADFHCCAYQCSYLKPTRVISSRQNILSLVATCRGNHAHEHLRGTVVLPTKRLVVKASETCSGSFSHWKTSLAGAYSFALLHKWSQIIADTADGSAFRLTGEPRLGKFWESQLPRQLENASEDKEVQIPAAEKPRTGVWTPWKGSIKEWGGGWGHYIPAKES